MVDLTFLSSSLALMGYELGAIPLLITREKCLDFDYRESVIGSRGSGYVNQPVALFRAVTVQSKQLFNLVMFSPSNTVTLQPARD